jgi:single-strand DNA-binding protein
MARNGINKVILVGNLGKDPQKRILESGVCVVNFPLATTESYKDKSGKVNDKTEWHNIVMWRGLAETAAKHLKKGATVYLEGKLTTRSWDNPDGKKNYKTEIEVDHMIMLGATRENPIPEDSEEVIFVPEKELLVSMESFAGFPAIASNGTDYSY